MLWSQSQSAISTIWNHYVRDVGRWSSFVLLDRFGKRSSATELYDEERVEQLLAGMS